VGAKKADTDGTATYIVCDGANVIMELDSNGNVIAEYTQGPQGLISFRRGGTELLCGMRSSRLRVECIVMLGANDTISVTYTIQHLGIRLSPAASTQGIRTST